MRITAGGTVPSVPWYGASLYVSGADKLFDVSGKLTDAATRERLSDFVRKFAEFVVGPK